jgi:hypothetical protein
MSEIKSDKLTPVTATTTTFGDSGDKLLFTTGTNLDMNGVELILDADADTSITADTDDQIDIRIAGADDFQFTANTFTAQSGSTIVGHLNATGDTSAGDNAAIGYTSAEGLILTGQGSTDDITIKNDADTTVVNVATGATDVEISAGNILFGTGSKGVYLGVTSATAANLLADYEEGSWTPNLSWSTGGTTGIVYTTQVGTYVKVGKLVHAAFFLRTSNNGTGSGAATITGLPFTVKNTTAAYGSSLVTNYRAGFGADHYPGGYAIKNDTGIYLQNLDPDSTGTSGISESDWTDTGQMYAHITYISES